MKGKLLAAAIGSVCLCVPAPAAAQVVLDDAKTIVRGTFSGTLSDSTAFDGWVFYTAQNAGLIRIIIGGEVTDIPIRVAEDDTSHADFIAQSGVNGGELPSAVFDAWGLSYSAGSYVGFDQASAERLNNATLYRVGFTVGSYSYSGPVDASFLWARALPEPGTWAMMLLGFSAIGLAVRRKQALSVAAY